MAGVTVIRRCDMNRTLAGSDCAIMTADTGAGDLHMIHRRRQHHPVVNRVATVAKICRGNVRRCLANGNYAIVATAAGTEYMIMIDRA